MSTPDPLTHALQVSLRELPVPGVLGLVRANWSAFYAHVGGSPGSELSAGQHLSWVLTGIPDPFLNVVFRTALPPDDADDVIEAALDHFRSMRITRLSWWADAADDDLGRRLASRGLTFDPWATAMAADLETEPDRPSEPAGLTIVPVEDQAMLERWIAVMRVGFGLAESAERRMLEVFAGSTSMPVVRTYLALLDGEPVATSQLFLAAGVAGVYNVTCLPEARGRGIGAAVTRAPLMEARQQGYRLTVLQASELGRRVYRRLGFEDYGHLGAFLFHATDESPVGVRG